MSPSDFSPLAGTAWWLWPPTCERELRLRSHFKTHERLLWEAEGGGSWWQFVTSVSPVNCLSLACLVCPVALAFQKVEVFGQREMSHPPVPDVLLLVTAQDDGGGWGTHRGEGHGAEG